MFKRWEKEVKRRTYGGEYETVTELDEARIIKDAAIGIATVIMLTWFWPFSSVPTGSQGVVTQFGKIKRIEGEGLVLTAPFESLHVFNVRTSATQVEGAQGSTADTQPVNVDLVVRYKIRPPMIAKIYEEYSHDGDLSSYVLSATQETFKAVTAKYTATELISQRSKVSSDIKTLLSQKLDLYGADVINVDMQSFAFSPDYMAAINLKVTEEQKRLAAENKARTVEAQQREVVIQATAAADAAKAKSDGEAYAKLTVAKAEAESLRIQNAALRENRDVLELKRIEVELAKANKWNGKLPENIYAGAPIPLVNIK